MNKACFYFQRVQLILAVAKIMHVSAFCNPCKPFLSCVPLADAQKTDAVADGHPIGTNAPILGQVRNLCVPICCNFAPLKKNGFKFGNNIAVVQVSRIVPLG